MFGKRFAYAFGFGEGEPWEDEPGHHGHHDRRWQRMNRVWSHGRPPFGFYARRGFFGRGPFGGGEPFGDEEFAGGPNKRFFGRGDLKYVLLELLSERPMHGYEMMKALQERTNGLYTPSAGSVYPTLQMLEDRDFVTVSEEEGKKVYSITDAGRAFLAEGPQEQDSPIGRLRRHRPSPEQMAELGAIRHEVHALQHLLGQVIRSTLLDPSKLKRLREILAQLRTDLEALAGQ